MIITPSHQLLPVAASLIKTNSPIIVEAGAFWGHDSLKMAQQWPCAIIHAFEPVPDIYHELVKRTAHMPTIKCHQQALSSTDGACILHLAYKKDRLTQASSVHQPAQRLTLSLITFPTQITVPSITLKSFMQQQQITAIDLLWLDLQGHEYAVLLDSVDILPSIKMIHMEVYFVQAYKDHWLYHDIVEWLEKYNFVVVAKDFVNETDSFFGNILCTRK